jgi:hypothetical protein
MAISVEFNGNDYAYGYSVVSDEQRLKAAELHRDAIDKSIADLKAAIEKKAAEAKKSYGERVAEQIVVQKNDDEFHIGIDYFTMPLCTGKEGTTFVRGHFARAIDQARRDAFAEAAAVVSRFAGEVREDTALRECSWEQGHHEGLIYAYDFARAKLLELK